MPAHHRLAPLNLDQPNVVGSVHSLESLQKAARLAADAVDILEIRLDLLIEVLPQLRKTLPKLPFPLLLTARHPREGGHGDLSVSARRDLLTEFLPCASGVDLELRSLDPLADVADLVAQRGVRLVISCHNFQKVPSLPELADLRRRAQKSGADIFKIAAQLHSAKDLGRMLSLFPASHGMHLSVMGMGDFGRVSRLLFARMGSVLNYGYLDRASVPGQWPAVLLKQRLGELQ